MSIDSISSGINLGREDVVALVTFPLAALFFAISTAWLNSVNNHTNKPLIAKLEELDKLKKEAEELNRSSTILLHGKKMREVTKVEDEISLMRQRRSATRRQVILGVTYYAIQSIGLVVLYFACQKLGYKTSLGFSSQGTNVVMKSTPLDEIVMVPHCLTSYWVETDKATGLIRRSAIPILGHVRSLGFFSWYVMCLVTVKVMVEAFFNRKTSAVSETKQKKE